MDIVVADYSPAWPGEFNELAARVGAALAERARAIHHIGSTSVPGLAAKDIIDIQVTVADLAGEAFVEPLQSLGWVMKPYTSDHCPPGMDLPKADLAKRVFGLEVPRRANLHVRVEGRFNQRFPILFRDFLRAHPEAAAAYGEVKRQLARHVADDWDAYYDVKDPAVDLIMVGARNWAVATGWSPPESDV